VAFLKAFNIILKNRDEILQSYEAIIHTLTDTSKLDKESTKLQSELEVVTELLRKCFEENAYNAMDQLEYQERYIALVEHYENIKNGLIEINDKFLERNAKRESIREFILAREQSDTLLTEFEEEFWNATIEEVRVYSEHQITFIFKDGIELEWNI
jgi:site-specific DNA recombinase